MFSSNQLGIETDFAFFPFFVCVPIAKFIHLVANNMCDVGMGLVTRIICTRVLYTRKAKKFSLILANELTQLKTYSEFMYCLWRLKNLFTWWTRTKRHGQSKKHTLISIISMLLHKKSLIKPSVFYYFHYYIFFFFIETLNFFFD